VKRKNHWLKDKRKLEKKVTNKGRQHTGNTQKKGKSGVVRESQKTSRKKKLSEKERKSTTAQAQKGGREKKKRFR